MLKLITGVMGSGKSAHLIHRYEEALLVTPQVYTTEKGKVVTSRNGDSVLADDISMLGGMVGSRDQLILIDEAQWMTTEQIELANELAKNNDVILYGLLRSFDGQMYPAMKLIHYFLDSMHDWEILTGTCMVEGCCNQAQYHNKLDDLCKKESFQSCCLKHWKHKGGK